MHVVICKYAADPDVVAKMRPRLAHLEQTLRQTTGVVAYYSVEADDGLAIIIFTDDEASAIAATERAGRWVQQNAPTRVAMDALDVTRGHALISATR